MLAWREVRWLQFGYGGHFSVVVAGSEGIHISLRRTSAVWSLASGSRARWHASSRWWPAETPLQTFCIRRDHDRWILPGLWMGAGRDAFVDYFDVILPNWLTM